MTRIRPISAACVFFLLCSLSNAAHSQHQEASTPTKLAEPAPSQTPLDLHPAHLLGPIDTAPHPYDDRATRPCKAIHGCLPYWIDPNLVPWDVVTHLACYAIVFHPDGTIENSWRWPWTATIAAARSRGIEVLPIITLGFDDDANETFLHDPVARSRMIDALRPMMTPHADGIYIDLEGNDSARWAPLIPDFARQLRSAFRADNPAFKIYAAVPPMDWTQGWDFIDAASACDALFFMGYDYFGPFSWFSGPSGPLTGLDFCITNSLNYYYRQLLTLHPDRLVLGVPFYANHWITQGPEPYSTVVRFVEQLHYDRAAELASPPGRQRFDGLSTTPWAVWNENDEWHQVWFDDVQSLSRKFDEVDARRLGGIGIWALGFDGQRPELHDLLVDRFIDSCARECVADMDDGSGAGRPDRGVTVDDLIFFLHAYSIGLIIADIDDGSGTGTPDSGVTVDDLVYYLARYVEGC